MSTPTAQSPNIYLFFIQITNYLPFYQQELKYIQGSFSEYKVEPAYTILVITSPPTFVREFRLFNLCSLLEFRKLGYFLSRTWKRASSTPEANENKIWTNPTGIYKGWKNI